MDPARRAALFIRMNDLVIQNVITIPIIWRNVTAGGSTRLKGADVSGWDSNIWNLASWYREA
jgi:peptide/nickel transport system substrate-binding protein